MSFLSAFVAFVLPVLPPSLPTLDAVLLPQVAAADAPMRYPGIEALFRRFDGG